MKYSRLSRIIHWTMAILIISTISLGIYMKDYLPKDSDNRFEIYDLHKSFGVLILILFFIRFINRLINKAPDLPEQISNIDKKLAKFGHFVIYALMFVVPISGYLMSNTHGYSVALFSIEMPRIAQANHDAAKIFEEIHENSAFILLFFVGIHVLAVIKHAFFDKNRVNLLKRMI